MTERFVDRLQRTVLDKGPLCVGLDPVFEALPAELRESGPGIGGQVRAAGRFAREVIDAVKDIVGVVKLQVAFFERYGAAGFRELEETARHARAAGLLVISDCKRGDIGSTMQAYVEYHLGLLGADAMTLNPYMGRDVLDVLAPQLEAGKGAFMLLRTSNPAAAEVQGTCEQPDALYRRMAGMIAGWQAGLAAGASGYLPVGAVVGATGRLELAELRSSCQRLFFLVPGYGRQGATTADVAGAFDSQCGGAVVNASRSVLYAFREDSGLEETDWRRAVRRQASKTQDELAAAALGGA